MSSGGFAAAGRFEQSRLKIRNWGSRRRGGGKSPARLDGHALLAAATPGHGEVPWKGADHVAAHGESAVSRPGADSPLAMTGAARAGRRAGICRMNARSQ